MSDIKYVELAKKLKALADKSSFEGERHTAQLQLDKVMKKYNITKEELEENRLERIEFKVPRNKQKLMSHIIMSVVGLERWLAKHRRKSVVYSEVTKAEEAEIRAKFNFFTRAFDDELELFYDAFIIKNNIVPKDFDPKKHGKKDVSEEDILKAQKIEMIAEKIKRAVFHLTLHRRSR